MTRRQTISKVLELKAFAQEQLDNEVKKAGLKLNDEREKLDRLEHTRARAEERFKKGQNNGTMQVSEMGLFYDYLTHIGRQIDEQRGVLVKVSQEFEIRRREMLEVYREKRVFEKFRDRIVYEEDRRALVLEQNESDYHFISKRLRK